MDDVIYITPDFAIGPQVEPSDFADLQDAGFRSVVNARPDDEIGEYLTSDDAAPMAEAAGLSYRFCPTDNHAIFEPDVIDRFEKALAELPQPIFAHCKTGTRSAMLWALVAARHRDVEEVISTLRDAGQEFDFLEDELRESAEASRNSPFRLKNDGLLSLSRSNLLGKAD